MDELSELTVLPTMLLSPAFVPSLWTAKDVGRYPLFEAALLQTRDLAVWLMAKLGIVDPKWSHELRESLSQLATQLAVFWDVPGVLRAVRERLLSAILALEHLKQLGADADEEMLHSSGVVLAARLKALYSRCASILTATDGGPVAADESNESTAADRAIRMLGERLDLSVLTDRDRLKSTVQRLAQGDARSVASALHRAMCTSNPGAVPHSREAARQLLDLCGSLFSHGLVRPPSVRSMSSLSVFVPFYKEEVAQTMAQLQAADDDENASSLKTLSALFPLEWSNMIERTNMQAGDHVEEGPLAQLAAKDRGAAERFAHAEVVSWAADRQQTLWRTVRGAMLGADSLRVVGRMEGVEEDELEQFVGTKFELIASCQLYGFQKHGDVDDPVIKQVNRAKAAAVDRLLERFSNHFRVAYVDVAADGAHYSVLI
eukprot:4390573-Prymnesium_polylepis.1